MISDYRYELLAKAMVGRYRLGYVQIAMLIACNLFEAIINRKLKVYDKEEIWSDEKLNTHLDIKINRLTELSAATQEDSLFIPRYRKLFKNYRKTDDKDKPNHMADKNAVRSYHVKERLRNLRWLRNQIMHDKFATVKRSNDDLFDDMVNYVWSELASRNFKQYLTKWEDKGQVGRLVDTIEKHTADYMIRAIDEVDIRKIDDAIPAARAVWALTKNDFSNLFTVRDKLVSLKNYLNQWLKDRGSNLHTNTLTTIDTASGYIWMPLTSISDETQMGVGACPVSILATPVDVRVYLDFGGMAVQLRREYYRFLKSPEYTDFVMRFINKSSFYVFDTEWFCFVVKKKSVCMWLTDTKDHRSSDIEAANEEIGSYHECGSLPITWNRMLHGYIYDRDYFNEHPSLGLDVILNSLTDIISLHNTFDFYRKQGKANDK